MKSKMHEDRQAHTPLERKLSRRLRHAPSGVCLDFEQIVELARRGRRAPGYYAHMAHIISCPACRRSYLQARRIIEAQRPSLVRWLRRLRFPMTLTLAPAMSAAAIALAFVLWQPRAPQHVGEPSVIAATLDAVPPAGEAPTSDAQPRIADSRLETPSAPAASDELRRARQSPPFVASAVEWLQQSVAQLTLRSDEQSQTPWLHLRTPDIESNSAIEPGVVVFEWMPVDNAKGYRVRLTQTNRAEPVVDVALEVRADAACLRAATPPWRIHADNCRGTRRAVSCVPTQLLCAKRGAAAGVALGARERRAIPPAKRGGLLRK
jgi:hypothetical protein